MVEGARLESVYRGNSIEGSNPSLSARIESKISADRQVCARNLRDWISLPAFPSKISALQFDPQANAANYRQKAPLLRWMALGKAFPVLQSFWTASGAPPT